MAHTYHRSYSNGEIHAVAPSAAAAPSAAPSAAAAAPAASAAAMSMMEAFVFILS